MAFKSGITLEALNQMGKSTLLEHLAIEFTAIGENSITARMPVDSRTHQPYGLLHGGASVALAETLGSVAAYCTLNTEKEFAVGLDINANHLRSVRSGYVSGTTTPIHIGKSTQVWEIRITSEEGALVCISRITMAILEKK